MVRFAFVCVACVACAACGNDSAAASTTAAEASAGSAGGSGGSGGSGVGGGGGAEPAPEFCFGGALDVQPAANGFVATTTHYRLTAEAAQASAEEMARMLEAAYGAYRDYFAAEPTLGSGELLDVRLYATYDAWAAALLADGLTPSPEAGGYYDVGSRVAYLYDQPTRYFTHELLLHEAAHQYHHLARGGVNGQPSWYVEGLAEYLQRHDWDGACARVGVMPLLTQEDGPATALDDIGKNGVDLTAIVGGSVEPSRPVEWAFVHYLERGDDAKWHDGFRAFRDAMDGGGAGDVLASFKSSVGDPASLEAPFVAWLPIGQEPMSIVFLEWTHVGPHEVIGDSPYFSAAALKEAPAHFEARFDVPAAEPWAAGVLLDFDGPNDFTGLVVSSTGALSTFEMVGGNATWFDHGSAPPADGGGYGLVVDYASAGMVDVTIDGEKASYPISLSPRTGLAVNGGRVAFHSISWR